LLRSAREKSGLTLRDVSAQLHLDERTLASLEADDFRALPAPAFVRGYLRGYARLLGVPVGPVMEAYDREGFTPPDLVADISEKPETNSSDFPVRLTTWVVVVVLATLVVVWWNNQSVDEAPATPAEAPPAVALAPDTDTAPAGASPPPVPAPDASPAAPEVPAATAPEVAPTPAPPDPEPAEASEPSAATAEEPPAPTSSAAGDAAPATTEDVTRVVERLVDEAQQALERSRAEAASATTADGGSPGSTAAPLEQAEPAPEPSTASETAPTASPAQASAGARLYITFSGESWVEVYDAADTRLFYNLVQPGREIDVSGTPPIRVLLGNTAGVASIEYQGQAVDLSPYARRGVARLTLGP
jgi:cytoskeleton protein RodZ